MEGLMSDWGNKLDARGRALIADLAENEEVNVMLRLSSALDAAGRDALLEAGFSVHSESGRIVTGVLRKCDLTAVARLDFVGRIEVSRPLHAEPTD
jgi:hypothetical protein